MLTATKQIGATRLMDDDAEDPDETLSGFEVALEAARGRGDRQAEVRLLRAIGRTSADSGDYERARRSFEAILLLARGTEEVDSCVAALNGLAAIAQFRGEFEAAESLYCRAQGMARELGDERTCATIDQNLGTLFNTRGNLREALGRYESALRQFRQLGDDRAAGWVLTNMGMLQIEVEEFGAAALSLTSAYELAARYADLPHQGRIEANRAELYLKRQDYDRAHHHCSNALRLFTRIGSHSGLADAHRLLGMLHRGTGRLQMAHLEYDLALRLARTCENRLIEGEVESERARLLLANGQFRDAFFALNSAYEIFSDLEASREVDNVRRRLNRLDSPYFEAMRLWTLKEQVLREDGVAARAARVSEMAARMVRALGMPHAVAPIRIAAYLHDVGIAAIPPGIVLKPGPLTGEERLLLEQHTVVGEQLLRDLRFAPAVCAIVRHHHERWDGRGYPDGLAGADIPLLARIVCLADAYAALTSPRPFRAALAPESALALMRDEAGTVFDPALLDLFEQMVTTLLQGQGGRALGLTHVTQPGDDR